MSCQAFLRFAALLAAAATLSLSAARLQAGGCGCEAPCSTVHHIHHRGQHHGRCCPPTGMVVQSAPVMAAPMMMMAAPVMAAPMMMVPAQQVAFAPAASYSIAPQAAPNTCAGNISQDQLVRALAQVLANDPQAANALTPARAPARSAEARLNDLERRVLKLEDDTKELQDNTKEIIELMKLMQQKVGG